MAKSKKTRVVGWIQKLFDILCWGGNLRNIEPNFYVEEGPLGTQYFWVEPFILEKLLSESGELDKTINKILPKLEKGKDVSDLSEIQKVVYEVFAKQYLVEISKKFYKQLDLITRYMIAKKLAEKNNPEWFNEYADVKGITKKRAVE